jgi:hypothetical protein
MNPEPPQESLFLYRMKMVGIYSKIKNGLSWIQNKAMKNVIPFVGKLGDVMDSETLKKVLEAISPTINSVVPGLGTGLNAARQV